MQLLRRKGCRIWMIYCLCLLSLHSSGLTKPIVIHGYIDRMHPAVILLESDYKQIVVADEKMPKHSREGMWVDISIDIHGYEVLMINEEKTKQKYKTIHRLQDRLRGK